MAVSAVSTVSSIFAGGKTKLDIHPSAGAHIAAGTMSIGDRLRTGDVEGPKTA